MKSHYLFFLLSLISFSCNTQTKKSERQVVVPTETQAVWADAEVGVLIHFDMPVYEPDYKWNNFGTHPDPAVFNPKELDTDQWLETAHKLGAKYAVLVAKHCSGFSLWPTEAHPYSIKNSPWKNGEGDIVKDFIASCKKYNIKPGIYASTTANGYLYVTNPGVVQPGGPVTQEEYNKIVQTQLTELWTNYGELFEIWFDGGVLSKEQGGADVLSLVQKLQPNAVAFQGPYGHPNLVRWVGNEEGVAPYPCWATTDSTTNADGTTVINGLNGNSDAPYWCPGEADFTLRWNKSFQGGWFWREGEDQMMFTLQELMTKYVTSVGRNTNMLLGLVVDTSGCIPEADVKRVEEFGVEIRRRFDNPLMQMKATGYKHTFEMKTPVSIDRAIIKENIRKGERVLSYKLTGITPSGELVELSKGCSIGHKRIETFTPIVLKEVTLEITEAKETPDIDCFSIYETLK